MIKLTGSEYRRMRVGDYRVIFLHVAASYLSEIERGLKPGSVATLSRIADALCTTIDSLVRE